MMEKIFFKVLILQVMLITFSCAETGTGDEWQGPGFYKNPDELVKTIEKESSSYNKNFVLARAYKENKELKKAILYYANSAYKSKFNFNLKIYPNPVYLFLKSFSFKSPFYNDAVYEIASLFYDYGEHNYVVKFVNLIKDDDSFLYRDSVILKSKSFSRLSDEESAIKALIELSQKFTDNNSMGLINIRLASAYESLKDYSKASDAYFNIIKSHTDIWQDNIAAKRLAILIENKSIKIKDKDRILILANALLTADESTRALQILSMIQREDQDKESDITAIKIYTAKNRSEANSILNNKKNTSYYHNLVLEHANILWETGARHEAIRKYREIADTGNAEIARRVLVRLIFFYEDRNSVEAMRYMDKFIERFPGDELIGRLKWMTGRHFLKDGRYAEARRHFNESVKEFPSGDYSANCRYWLYLIDSSLKLSDSKTKEQALEELCFYNPESAYTLKILNEESDSANLKEKYNAAKNEKNIKKMLLFHTSLFIKEGYSKDWQKRISDFDNNITEPYKNLYNRISSSDLKSSYKNKIMNLEKYFKAGNISAVNRELKSIPENDEEAAIDIALAMALFSSKYEHYNYSTYYGFRLLSLLNIKENTALMPKKMSEIIYPRAFKECVQKESAAYKVSESLLYSMIKAESNYIPEALSPVGAVGLMQLMPATAAGIAKQLRIKDYELKDPCTSIKFGANYISWLSRMYKEQIEYIVSGYNAGPGNVNNWIERFKSQNIEYFAEFAPFAETRGYIYRTIKFSIQYKSIYR